MSALFALKINFKIRIVSCRREVVNRIIIKLTRKDVGNVFDFVFIFNNIPLISLLSKEV